MSPVRVRFCPECGRLVHAHFAYCPYCGKAQSDLSLEQILRGPFERIRGALAVCADAATAGRAAASFEAAHCRLVGIDRLEEELDRIDQDLEVLEEAKPGGLRAQGR